MQFTKITTVEKRAYRPQEFQAAYGIAKSYFYEQVALGRLKIIKVGRATLVTREAAEEWLLLCAQESTKILRGGGVLRRRQTVKPNISNDL